uniref:Uncharacterized protein n=1 Tax=Ananas comosus var. bracteatus TaxID=296719 RepID=A0A6V7NEG4_ANACO|nr:unnamed protein product [Ananas comosus var. bracteatus]
MIATFRLPSLRHPRPHLNLRVDFHLFLALTLISPSAKTLTLTLDFSPFAAHPFLIGASASAPSPPPPLPRLSHANRDWKSTKRPRDGSLSLRYMMSYFLPKLISR